MCVSTLTKIRLGLVMIVKNDGDTHADDADDDEDVDGDDEDDCEDDGNGDGGNGLASLRKCTQRAIPRDTRPSIVKQKH